MHHPMSFFTVKCQEIMGKMEWGVFKTFQARICDSILLDKSAAVLVPPWTVRSKSNVFLYQNTFENDSIKY